MSFRLCTIFLWVSVTTKVIRTDCPHPGHRFNVEINYLQNVDQQDSFKEYTVLMFYCKRGNTYLTGHKTAVCMNSTWQHINEVGDVQAFHYLLCKEKTCPARRPANGNVMLIGTTIKYACNKGYELQGRNVSRCRLNGRGDFNVVHSSPRCVKLKTCAEPQDENLVIHGECCYAGDKLEFSCNSQYQMEGNSTSTCKRNGQWSHPLPRCNLMMKCIDPGYASFSSRQGNCCEIGNNLTYICNSGYEFVNTQQHSIITCLPNKTWNHLKPKCKLSTTPTCPDIPFAENNLVMLNNQDSEVFFAWDEIVLECISHYSSDAKTMSLICLDDGQWDAPIPVCKPLSSCKRPPNIQHGKIIEMIDNLDEEFPIDYEINIECDKDYELIHYVSRCLGDDKWENGISNCTLIQCEDPGVPENAIRHGDDFHLRKNVTYSCLGNSQLIGSAIRTCLSNKQWSGFLPKCDSEESSTPSVHTMPDNSIALDDTKGTNIYFLLANSGRTTTRMQVHQSKELIISLIRQVEISKSEGGIRVGVITFGKFSSVIVYPSLDRQINLIIEKISNIQREVSGANIARALESLITLILTTRRSQERRNSRNILFFISDGYTTEGGQPTTQVMELQRMNIDIYVVATGQPSNKETLLLIANNKPQNIFTLMDYRKLHNLFAEITISHTDYSLCGLDRVKLSKHELKSETNKEHNQKQISAFGRVLGGNAAQYNWPWMAAIYLKNARNLQFYCSGTIIHTKWILSAAHCFAMVRKEGTIDVLTTHHLKKQWLISVGHINLNDKNSGLIGRVKQVKIHQGFNPTNYQNDIALLELSSPLRYNVDIRPICLPPPLENTNNLYRAQESAVVVGWGHTEVVSLNSTRPKIAINTLNELTVPLQPSSVCNKPVQYECQSPNKTCELTPGEGNFCTGTGRGGEDTCQGDSGSPLMRFTESNNTDGRVLTRWVQIGIVSWGIGCGIPGHYSYYTHVSKLREWIVNATGITDFEQVEPLT